MQPDRISNSHNCAKFSRPLGYPAGSSVSTALNPRYRSVECSRSRVHGLFIGGEVPQNSELKTFPYLMQKEKKPTGDRESGKKARKIT
jgi:hypothetical protein